MRYAIIDTSRYYADLEVGIEPTVLVLVEAESEGEAVENFYGGVGGRIQRKPGIYARALSSFTPAYQEELRERFEGTL